MKRKLMIIGIGIMLVGCITGCGKVNGIPEPVAETYEASVAVDGIFEVAEDMIGIQEKNNIAWNAGDIYLQSIHSGYLSGNDLPQGQILMIAGEGELQTAENKYHLGQADVDENGVYTTSAQAFQTMKNQYPIQDYVYFVAYQTVTSGGYDLITDLFTVVNGEAKFELSQDSSTPGADMEAIDMMDGFLFLAAVERGKMEGVSFNNVISPSGNMVNRDLTKAFNKPEDESSFVVNSYNGKYYVANCMLFRLSSDASEEEVEKLMASYDMVVVEKNETTREYKVSFSVEKTEEELMEMENWLKEFAFVEDASLFYVSEEIIA